MWGFLLYHALPFKFFLHVNYSIPSLSPTPINRSCVFVAGVRTVYNSLLGNPAKLFQTMQEKGVELALSYNSCPSEKLIPLEVSGISYKDIPTLSKVLYILFEFLPKSLVFEKPKDLYSLYSGKVCKPFLSDIPVIASFMSLDVPSYSFILGNRRNLLQGVECKDLRAQDLPNAIPVSERVSLNAYLYSERGYYFPGQTTQTKGRYVIKVATKNILVLFLKNDKLAGVYDQNYINEPIKENGTYSAKIYTYKFKIGTVYFGLRFLSCLPPLQAM